MGGTLWFGVRSWDNKVAASTERRMWDGPKGESRSKGSDIGQLHFATVGGAIRRAQGGVVIRRSLMKWWTQHEAIVKKTESDKMWMSTYCGGGFFKLWKSWDRERVPRVGDSRRIVTTRVQRLCDQESQSLAEFERVVHCVLHNCAKGVWRVQLKLRDNLMWVQWEVMRWEAGLFGDQSRWWRWLRSMTNCLDFDTLYGF